MVKTQLIPSGTYLLYQDLPPAQFLARAWEQDATAVNYAISVYAEGKKPNYPAIDSISFNKTARAYYTLMYENGIVKIKNTHPIKTVKHFLFRCLKLPTFALL